MMTEMQGAVRPDLSSHCDDKGEKTSDSLQRLHGCAQFCLEEPPQLQYSYRDQARIMPSALPVES